MNFLCDKCKQKYHVADEKLRGRAVTRFRCKKCEHIIELMAPTGPGSDFPAEGAVSAGTSAPPPVASIPVPKPPAAAFSPRPRAATITAPVGSPLGGAIPLAGRVGASATAGIAPVAPGVRPAAPRPRSATTTGPAFGAGAATAPRPAPSVRAAPAPARPASASAILNASETGWYAGIRDLPVGPLTRKELAAKVQSGDVSPDTLVWREGLDDWRPLRGVAELGDLLRMAAQRMSGDLLDEMGKRPTPASATDRARGGQVVPLSASRGASPAPSEHDAGEDDATHVSPIDRELLAAIRPNAPFPKAPSAAFDAQAAHDHPEAKRISVPPSAPTTKTGPSLRSSPPATPSRRPLSPSSAPPAARTSVEPPAPQVPVAAPWELDASPETKPAHEAIAPAAEAVSPPDVAPVNLFATIPPVTSAAPAAAKGAAASALPASLPPDKRESRGLPVVGLAVLGIGVLVVGVFGGVLLSARLNNHPPPVVVPSVPFVATPPVRVVAPPIEIPPEAPPTVAPPTEAPAETPDPGVATSAPAEHGSHPRHGNGGAVEPRVPTPSAEDLRILREASRAGGGPVMGPVGTTPTHSSGDDSTQAASNPGARGGAIIRAFNNAQIVNHCWQASLRRNPALGHQPTRVTVDVTVDSHGRVTGTVVGNSPDPIFTSCVQTRADGMAPIGPGEGMTGRASYNLDVNN